MMEGFREGYEFFQRFSGSVTGAYAGEAYIGNIVEEINKLTQDMNAMEGFNTSVGALKGDAAEFWHSGTFNVNAAVRGSSNRTYVDRSHDFASADVSSNFGDAYGLKYYKTGADSAKQQAKSLFERYKEYQAQGGKDSLEKFMSDRDFDPNDGSVLNEAIYSGQYRLIPSDQLKEAEKYLMEKIAKEQASRPEQVQRYKDTLAMLRDRIADGEGTESVPLSKADAEELARLAKEGGFDPADWGLTTENLVSYKHILQQSLKAGLSAATLSMVLKVAPEIMRSIDFLIHEGYIDKEHFKSIGFAAVDGAADGFIRGTVSAAITSACLSGLWGEALKQVSPNVIASVTVIAMNTMKNSFAVACGRMSRQELINNLARDSYITACSLVTGSIVQGLLGSMPGLGFFLGSFLGSAIGGVTYSIGQKAVLSFCVDSGWTMFGLVEQDYKLPEHIMKEIGLPVFEYEQFEPVWFEADRFQAPSFEVDRFRVPAVDIVFLRRGVIGVSRVGYV